MAARRDDAAPATEIRGHIGQSRVDFERRQDIPTIARVLPTVEEGDGRRVASDGDYAQAAARAARRLRTGS